MSVYCAGELEWLLNQLSSFKTVIELYGLIGNIQECVQPYLSGDDTPKSRTEGNINQLNRVVGDILFTFSS